jgi:hypothetical protein
MSQELSSVIGNQLSLLDISGLDQPGLPAFKDLAVQVISGEFDLTLPNILSLLSSQIFHEVILNTQLIRQLLIVAILSALLKCMIDAFRHSSASLVGFYVTYCMMVILAMSSFPYRQFHDGRRHPAYHKRYGFIRQRSIRCCVPPCAVFGDGFIDPIYNADIYTTDACHRRACHRKRLI